MTSAAKDEFDQLFNTSAASSGHPEDDHHDSAHSPDAAAADSSPPQHRSLRDGVHQPDSDDDLEAIDRATADSMRTRYFLPRKQHDANTGPKGVIADAYAFESAKKASERLSFLPALSGFTPSEPAPQYRRHDEEKRLGEAEDEDEFMARWRQARLNELQSSFDGGKIAASGRTSSPGGRRYGSLVTVDAEGYLDAVEKSPRGVTVVVLIYDDSVSSLHLRCGSLSKADVVVTRARFRGWSTL